MIDPNSRFVLHAIREDAAFVGRYISGGDECVELQRRVLTRRTHTRVSQKPHALMLTRKHPSRPLLRRNTSRRRSETTDVRESGSVEGGATAGRRVSKSYCPSIRLNDASHSVESGCGNR